MAAKKTAKSKIIPEDISELLNKSQFLKESPKGKKSQKRQRNEPLEEEENDMARIIGQYQASIKKKKIETDVERDTESRKKILDLFNNQLQVGKQYIENLFESLSEVTTQVETDYNALKDNEQKLEQLTRTIMKCSQQATTACKHKLKALKEIQTLYKKKYDDIETNHKAEAEKLVDELDCDIKNLQDKLVTEGKRSSWESIRRSIFHAMQNDF